MSNRHRRKGIGLRALYCCLFLAPLLISACAEKAPFFIKTKVLVECSDCSRTEADGRPRPPLDSFKKPEISPDQLPSPSPSVLSACDATKKDAPDVAQQTDVWCWAASSQAVMAAHGVSIKQCDIVNQSLRTDQCCADKYHGDCQRNSWPHIALEANEFQWDWVRNALPKDKVQHLLCSVGPFIAVFLYPGGGGHSFVVEDYDIDGTDGQLYVWVQDHQGQWDPIKGEFLTDAEGNRQTAAYRRVSYEAFASGEWEGAQHDHVFDYIIYPGR